MQSPDCWSSSVTVPDSDVRSHVLSGQTSGQQLLRFYSTSGFLLLTSRIWLNQNSNKQWKYDVVKQWVSHFNENTKINQLFNIITSIEDTPAKTDWWSWVEDDGDVKNWPLLQLQHCGTVNIADKETNYFTLIVWPEYNMVPCSKLAI